MGCEPGSFTYRGLTQGLPVSYGRWVCSQLVAAFMRLNHDLPLFTREELHRNPLLNERLTRWEMNGALTSQLGWKEIPREEALAALEDAGPSSDIAPAVAAPADAVEPAALDNPEPRSGKRIQPLQAPEWIDGANTEDREIWKITPEDQMQDPQICFIR
eukprot:2456416-Pleurochrysis_carterae.AAC.1